MQNNMKNYYPKISVAIVTYNCISTISETLDSVLNQRYDNLEIIIVDGGSDDGTVDLIKNSDSKILLISEPDEGIYDAMNKALNIASGDYIIFLGSDDHFVSYTVLSEVVSNISDTSSIYYGNVLRPQKLDIYCQKYNRYKLAIKNISHQAIFYPKIVYKNNTYDTKYQLYADYVYNVKLWKKVTFKYIPIVVSYYNENGISSKKEDVLFNKNKKKILSRHLGLLPYILSYIYHSLRCIIMS